jgi:Arc/MetJ-type ribon-helix-helix transcriptional regulator
MKVAMSVTIPIEYANLINELVERGQEKSRSKLVINSVKSYCRENKIPIPEES